MAHDFTVTHSELLISAPIIGVRRDRVTMPGGGEAAREIVEHFGAVAVVALDGEGRVALVEQYRHSVGRRLLELPAGLLDIADEPALECARRELREEAGLAAENWGVLVDLVTSPGFADEAVRVFLATGLSQVERPEVADEEADMTLTWVPLDTARRAVLEGRIVNSIAVSGILAAGAALESGEQPRSVDDPFDVRPTALASRRRGVGSGGDMKRI
ncbi:NUDIX domain-containing protein [Corynebacterium auris]|uniref:NUDIX domain-containing protein n=1 Tax=Corynebacterium auris TaxID=44750 RepID=UPI0025B41D96|nr:NUDIX hydrolase [Corynebacterium auris]WJY67999.1 ADP-ribose pyrophosphatase [Corynebacterium auris]